MAPVTAGTLYFVEEAMYKAEKALICAKFNGVSLKTQKFDVQKDAKKPDFLAKNATGKVPYLETDMGCIFTSNAVARYIARTRADTSLYGECFDDESQIDTWLEFCIQEVEIPLMTWVYPVMGLMEDAPEATKDAQTDVKKALTVLEDRLKSSAYLVGSFVSLADIVLVCALREGFVRVFDPAFRKPFPKVCAWFESLCKMPQFKSVLGDVKLCAQAAKPQPVKPAFAQKSEKMQAEAKAKVDPKKNKEAAPKAEAAPKKSTEGAQPKAAATAPAGGIVVDEVAIKGVGDEIRILKDKLKAEGLSGKKINEHPEIKTLVDKLTALKAGAPAPAGAAAAATAAAAAPAAAPAAAGGIDEAAIKAVGDEIRTLKEKLKGEGLSGKKINEHAEIKQLVDKLSALKAGVATKAAIAPTPAAAPAASGEDVEAQVTAVGSEIRTLKEKLKAEGLSGKKINDHAEVKALVTKLQELKSQL